MLRSDMNGRADKRFQIFVSSTFNDLTNERKIAVDIISQRHHIPIALDNFSASNDSDLKVIARTIEGCQVYVVILGHRYGEIVTRDRVQRILGGRYADRIPENGISYTELEYVIAVANDLLILPFILKDADIYERRKALDPDKSRDDKEIKNYSRLQEFHHKVSEHFYKPWGKDDNLALFIANALNDALPECQKPGFILEPEEPIRGLLQSASRNRFIVNIVQQLSGFEKLDNRCVDENGTKQAAAKFFWEHYTEDIRERKVSLFFESGSSMAYVAQELLKTQNLSGAGGVDPKGQPNIHLSTNNVLVFLQFWLKGRVPCTLFPWGAPEQTYGACFGSLATNLTSRSPAYDLHPLNSRAQEQIKILAVEQYRLEQLPLPVLLLGATSGLQLGEHHKVTFKPEDDEKLDAETKNRIIEDISKCYGPHVGSYQNKIFKRYMYQTQFPLMVILTGEKIDSEIEVGKCHFILDGEETWEKFYKEHPLAFCVGCTIDVQAKLVAMFKSLGFDVIEGPAYHAATCFIARNKVFITKFENVP